MDDNEKISVDVVFEYTGVGCSVPKDITTVRFNEGLRKIGDGSFRECKSLHSITLPSTVTEIGCNAFHGCVNLREITLNDGLQKIGDNAFIDCKLLESITLPSTVTEIDYHAFSDCSNLREVTLNDGLQKIGSYAFVKCASLPSITLPSTVTEIDDGAFGHCSNLREVTLNEGLQKIGIWTFYRCSSLESITIPTTATEIGSYAFGGCINLREVELNEIPQRLGITAFRNCDALGRFLLPTLSYRLEKIIQTSHWEELNDKVNEVRGVVQWDGDKLIVSTLSINYNRDIIRRDLGRINRLVSYYELKEATSTFELALWKSKLDQADATDTTNCAAYRIEVPGPVKDTILQYLDHML